MEILKNYQLQPIYSWKPELNYCFLFLKDSTMNIDDLVDDIWPLIIIHLDPWSRISLGLVEKRYQAYTATKEDIHTILKFIKIDVRELEALLAEMETTGIEEMIVDMMKRYSRISAQLRYAIKLIPKEYMR